MFARNMSAMLNLKFPRAPNFTVGTVTLLFSPNYYNNKRKLKSPNFTGGNLNNDFETDWFQVRHKNTLTSRLSKVEMMLHKHGVIPGVGQKHRCNNNGV
jgi:hypothetical protein